MVEILEHIKENDNDLVVVGSEGLQGVGLYVLGSVAERISRNAPCSCLVVR
jgi:nucleotide-binding universal stress UspA family protein